MELGIARSELLEMDDEEVIRKWVIGLELAERRSKATNTGIEGSKTSASSIHKPSMPHLRTSSGPSRRR